MTATEPKKRMIRRAGDERLTEYARGIVKGEYLIVDDDPLWQMALLLIADGIINTRNLGVVLVPVGPHMGGRWINGKVPGVVVQVQLVAKGDMPALQAKVDAMNAVLYPEATS